MAAGIAWAIRQGRDMVNAVKLGMAAAAENVRRLETGRLDPVRVQQEAELVRVEAFS
jgi:fructose-1-phosphate kinase PfkB-like protein